jgi:hypothetical protein
MENGVEKNISKEEVSKVITLSREISRIKVINNNSDEANERGRNFLMGNFPAKYESVEEMINLSQDPGRNENDLVKKNAKESLDLLGSAVLLAGQNNNIEDWIVKGEVLSHLPSVFSGVEKVLGENLLVDGENDTTGKEIVRHLSNLEKINKRAEMAPNLYSKKKIEETKVVTDLLCDMYDDVDSDSKEGLKLGAVIGSLDRSVSSKETEKIVTYEKKESGYTSEINFSTKTALSESEINNLGLEIDSDMWERLKGETTNLELKKALIVNNEYKKSENTSRKNNEKKLPEGGVEGLYKMIGFIEKGSSSVDDLSRNSEYYRVLYQVQIGAYDDLLIGEKYNGEILDIDKIDIFKKEIQMRMFLHGFYLAASKCKSIEDVLRVISATHEGNINGSLDREFVSFFLKEKGAGLGSLPVDLAWNLRQKGYFEIQLLKEEMAKDTDP